MNFFKTRSLRKAIDGHYARSLETVKLIESHGADPSMVRPIDLHFWAFDETSAQNLATTLQAKGYGQARMNPVAGHASLWNVETKIETAPESVAAFSFIENLATLAAENGGEFDGWGTSV